MFTRAATTALALVGLASALNDKDQFMKESEKLGCYIYTDSAFYDIVGMHQETPYTRTVGATTYKWNFCNFQPICGGEDDILAAAMTGTPSSGICTPLSGTKQSDVTSAAVEKKDDKTELQLTYAHGGVCDADRSKTYSFQINIQCPEKDEDQSTRTTSVNMENPCKPIVTMASKHGCAKFSSTAFIAFLSKHPWFLGAFLIVFGAVVTFFGRQFFKYTLAVVGGLVGFLGSMLLFSLMGLLNGLESSKASIALTVIMFLVALALGVLLGFVLFKTIRAGACVLGGVCGAFGGVTFYQLVLSSVDSFWLLLVLSITAAAAGAYLAYVAFDQALIITTGIIGAYGFVRGISLFAGHFPNEIKTFEQLANGAVPQLPYQFYLYLAAIVILAVLGIVFQNKRKNESDADDEYQKM